MESAAVLALVDLSSQLQRRGEAIARQAGLSAQQWLLLLHVAGEPELAKPAHGQAAPGILASDVATIRGVTQANISRLVAGLIRRGLVNQGSDAADARRRRLVITARGVAVLEGIEPYRREANRLLLADLAPAERRRFAGFLHRCLERLRVDREDAWLQAASARAAQAPRALRARPNIRPRS